MNNQFRPVRLLFQTVLLSITLTCISCQQKPAINRWWTAEDSIRITNEIVVHRQEADSFFRDDPQSPFRSDSSAHYDGIKWFPPDLQFYFRSKLYRYETPETVSVFGTKGEERKQLKYGYFFLFFNGQRHKLNIYKFTSYDARRFEMYKDLLSVWFTDETTGKETYEVGRYVEIGDESSDINHIYTINLNNAYNPYCAYSPAYSCAIPRKEDRLDFPVLAGEQKYHR